MVKSTFKKILNNYVFKKHHRLDIGLIEETLKARGYNIHNNTYKLSAYKHNGEDRFHIEVDIFPDNDIHIESEMRIHKDIHPGFLFHATEFGKVEVSLEYTQFAKELINQLKKRKMIKSKHESTRRY